MYNIRTIKKLSNSVEVISTPIFSLICSIYTTQLIPNPINDIMHTTTICEVGKLLVSPEPYITYTHAIMKNSIITKQLNADPNTIVTDFTHLSAMSSFQGHIYNNDAYSDIFIRVRS